MSKSSKLIEKEFKNLRKNLLDLTLRNQLLNFKDRAKTIRINNQSVTNMFQTLVMNHKKMYFSAAKKEKEEKSKFSIWDHSPIDFSKFTEGDVKLQADLTPNELQKRLFYINNQAKTMLEEQGYNILYIACGFLEWYDNVKPKQKNLAPLILIPVAIERKTVGKSFNLYWTGEEIQTNISLKAKLKENGIILPEFEQKNYSEVIEDYLRQVRDAVSTMDKWKVNGDIALGFFSFTKLVMYNDLNPESWEDNVDLTKNELIEAIFNPAKNKQEAFHEEDIDRELTYSDMYQVLDADSSQIAAIQDVKAGRNLVVEGPPGTGKSQTIVNLIAELLAEGKSVLFVAEKMAALDVVKDRLTSVGLGRFVLELHSHKTRRKKLLKDLQKATNVRYKNDLKIDQTIRKLETLRTQLDEYAEVIHKPLYAVNLSAFQLYGMKESADVHFSKKGTIIPLVRFENPEKITLKDLDDITIYLENLAELYQTISKENPWSKCAPKSLLPADLREIELLINDTLFSLDNFLVERDRVYDIYGIKKPNTLNDFKQSLSAFELIKTKNTALIDANILRTYPGNPSDANKLISTLERYQKSADILEKFNDNILHVNINQLMIQVQQLSNKKFKLFKNKSNMALVEPYYITPIPNIKGVLKDLAKVKDVLAIKKELDANEELARKYFGEAWHLKANTNDLKDIISWMNEFSVLRDSGMVSSDTIQLLSKDLFDFKPEEDLADYIEAGDNFNKTLSRLKAKLNPRSKLIFRKDSGDVELERWKEQLNSWRGQLSSLHLWSQYLNTKNSCNNSDSIKFIDAIEKRNVKKEDVKAMVDGNFADSLLNLIFVENQALVTFIGELHENRIQEFKDLDKEILLLNRKRIYQKLNNNMPKIFGATDDPEAKILAGEFTRKSGHLPVRKLLEKAGGTIKQIKPCFMMSPLSVAQYLDPTNEKLQFDVVIFDEASQVKPEDALGAFMRGKTAVVMGDTQQLPPTSFFEQLASGESEEEVATALDMESILHLCKLSFPVKMLKWHYRSRHESLISVSNTQFYDDELLVYPSPSHSDPELGLKFFYNPDTYYERGSGSKNPLEAKAVVKEIFNHFDKYGNTKSLGVGTFSVAQKNAILEELEIQRKTRPELEPLFAESREERFFVKNLETIQGDERDVILISVGYGYDQEGKMSLNFGPLNQDGGERRLNVLITRAREKCVVFSNFKAHDMHMTANPPFGVKALYEFLEYAENLTLGTYIREETPEAPFEDAIANFLEENGYEVDKQIGCAGFRVDLAIKDPENPGKYFLGITTDGKMYASSKVARDRDRLREQVLTGLGWRLYHLWATDWYRNRDLAKNKLLNNISKNLDESRAEEKRKSEEAKRLAEQRKAEALKLAEELKLAREAEEAAKKEKQEKENIAVIDSKAEDISEIKENSPKKENITIIDPNVGDIPEYKEVSLDKEDIIIDEPVNDFIKTSDIKTTSNEDEFIADDSTSEIYVEKENLDFEYIETEEDISDNQIVTDNVENIILEDSDEDLNSINEEKTETISKKSILKHKLSFDVLKGKSELIADDLELESEENKEVIDDISDDVNEEVFDNDSLDENIDEEKYSFLSKLKVNPFKLKEDKDSIDSEDEVSTNDIINEVVIEPEVEEIEEEFIESSEIKEIPQKEVIKSTDIEEIVEEPIIPKKSSKTTNEEVINDNPITKEEIFEEFEPIETIKVDHEEHNKIPDEEIIETKDEKLIKDKSDDEDKVIFSDTVEEIYVDHEAYDNIPDDINQETFNFADIFMEDEHEIWEDESDVEKEFADMENKEVWEENPSENIVPSEEVKDKSGIINSIITNLKRGESKLEPKYDAHGNVVYKTEVIEDEKEEISVNEESEDVEINISDNISIIHEEKNQETINNNVNENFIDVDIDKNDIELEEQSPFDDYIVENENNNYYKEIKFKSNITLNEEKEDNMSPDERYSKEEKEYFERQKDYYKGASGITNPLKKNTIYKLDDEREHKSVKETLSGIKSDVKYINKTLKEIENPTPAEYVHVIDRTGEYVPEDEYTPDDSYLILEKEEEETYKPYDYATPVEPSIPDTPVITPEINEVEHLRENSFNKEDYINIETPKDYIVPQDNVELKKQIQDESLESIIISADEQYKEIEKERFKENNTLKAFDDKKLSKKMGAILEYEHAKNFGIETTKDLYDKPLDDVANSIYKIVQVEGPVHKDEVIKRIKDSCEISRAGVKFKDSISTAIDHGEDMGNILKIGDFLFDASNPEVTIRKRIKPNIDLISDEEIAQNIEGILLEKTTMEATKLTKKAARNFGFRSTSKKTATRINTVLDRLLIEGKVLMDNDIVELK